VVSPCRTQGQPSDNLVLSGATDVNLRILKWIQKLPEEFPRTLDRGGVKTVTDEGLELTVPPKKQRRGNIMIIGYASINIALRCIIFSHGVGKQAAPFVHGRGSKGKVRGPGGGGEGGNGGGEDKGEGKEGRKGVRGRREGGGGLDVSMPRILNRS